MSGARGVGRGRWAVGRIRLGERAFARRRQSDATPQALRPTARRLGQWLLVGGAALGAGVLADFLQLPAAWLLGPMLSTLVLALRWRLGPTLPRVAPFAAQAIIGMALSASFERSSFAVLADEWLPVLIVVALTLLLSLASGVLLSRYSALDAPTAALGTIPGGASGMVAMSDALDADARMVAFMQYVRLVVVVLSVSLLTPIVVSASLAGGGAAPPAGVAGAARVATAHPWPEYLLTAAVAALGAWGGLRLGLPAGAIIGPAILGAGLGIVGAPHGIWPPGVLPAAFALLGVQVGSRFDPASVRRIGRLALPVLGFVLALIAGCAALAWGLTLVTDLDLLSAYLATTPGGIDAATIAALDTGANTPLVLAVQLLRLLAAVLVGPPLVRWLLRRQQA